MKARSRKRDDVFAELTGSRRYGAIIRSEAAQREHWNQRNAFTPPAPDHTWCSQCERRVAARCQSRFCKA